MSPRDPITVADAQSRLAMLWMAGAAAIGALLLAQTVLGKYGSQTDKAWSWFAPTVFPTLTIIVTAWFGAEAAARQQTVEPRHFQMAFGLSAVYLAVVAGTLLVQPFSAWTPIELLALSHAWLGPTQGLAGIGIGKFFAAKTAGH
jgi:hypothetical protein